MRPGICFRLCTVEAYEELREATVMNLPAAFAGPRTPRRRIPVQPLQVPEMQRSDLTDTILRLKALGVDNLHKFDWLSPPPAEAAIRGLELLHALGALGDDARQGEGEGSLSFTACVLR